MLQNVMMAGSDRLVAEDVLMLVDHLFAKSLIISEGDGYRILQTVREFARQLLVGSEDEEQTKRRHFRYFCSFARDSEERIRGPLQHDWHKMYYAAQDDLRSALDFGFSRDDLALAASEMTFDLSAFWFNAGNFREAARYYQCALNACPSGESDLRARLTRRGAMMRLYSGDSAAGATMKEALEMALRVGSDQTIADAYFSYGLQTEDARDAIEHLEEALRRFEKLGDGTGIAFSLAGIAEVAFVEADYVTSRTFYRLAIARNELSGDIRSAGASTAALASIDLIEGNKLEAKRGFQNALKMVIEAGAIFPMYSMFALIIQFVQHEGRLMDAARLMGWCEKIRRNVGGIRDRMDQFIFEKVDRELRENLGEHDYSVLSNEGAALSNDDAIKVASQCLSE